MGENVHEDALDLGPQGDQGGEPGFDNNIIVHFAEVWSIKEKSMSTVPLPN